MRKPLSMVGVALVAMAIMALAPTAARHGPRPPGDRPPRRDDVHRGCPVHLEFRLHAGIRGVPRPGRALFRHRRRDRDQRLRQRLAAGRHTGRDRRRQPSRDDGLQLVADDAGEGRDEPRRMRVQRLCARPGRPGRRRKCEPVRAGLRRPHRGRRGGRRLDGLLVRQLVAARRRDQAQPQAGNRGRDRGQRLEPHRLHGHARRPGRLGQRVPEQHGSAIGVLSTLQILPTAGSNGVGDLGKELDYMRANSSLSGVQLEPGTEPFKPDIVAAIAGS